MEFFILKDVFPSVLQWKILFVLLLRQSETKRRYFISSDVFLGVLHVEIRIVLLLSLKQQHKWNFLQQTTYFLAFCNPKSNLSSCKV